MDTPSGYRISQAMSVWNSARTRLLDDPDISGDEETLSAMLGSAEGDVRDILARLLHAAQKADMMENAMANIIFANELRRHRYKRRNEALRATAFAIMDALAEKRLELPDMTVTIATGNPRVVVTNADDLEEMFVRVTRAPDKSAILAALKAGENVPGAELANGAPSIRIRSR